VLAETCEAAGVGGLFTSDHYLSESKPTRLGGLDAWAVIARLASIPGVGYLVGEEEIVVTEAGAELLSPPFPREPKVLG
jgi:hypothetical protein